MTINNFDAIFFDCDGVIAETERDVHRVTFNAAFKEKNIDTDWDVDRYGVLLKVGGGKERMKEHFNEVGWPSFLPETDKERDDIIKELHLRKTALFQSAVEGGACPARPGIIRLIDEAFSSSIPVAICSTSNEMAVTTIARTLLGEERLSKIKIFAGDVVKAKKPAPDVYNLAANTVGVDPCRCWVVEDSGIGLQSAKAAGMKCIVTKSIYTKNNDFEEADVVVDDLDSGLDGPITISYLDYKAGSLAYAEKKPTENSEMFGAGKSVADMFSKISKGDMGKGMPF